MKSEAGYQAGIHINQGRISTKSLRWPSVSRCIREIDDETPNLHRELILLEKTVYLTVLWVFRDALRHQPLLPPPTGDGRVRQYGEGHAR